MLQINLKEVIDMLLYQILAYIVHGINKFKISAPTWNEKFELPNGLYSISDIQDYFEYIKKTWRKDY